MRAYDPLPDFNCNDPYPDDLPRRPSHFGIIVVAWVFAGVVLVGTAIFLALP